MNVVVLAQAAELAHLGHRVRLITRRSDPAQPNEVEIEPGLTVHHLDAGPARLLAKGEHEALIEPFGEALRAHLEDHPTDLLHAEHWYSGLAALPSARELGIPLVQSYHSIAAAEDTPLGHGERPEAPGRLAGERRLAHEADLIITVSEAEKRTVVERLGGAPDRVRVVWPGVNTRLFRPCGGVECEERVAWLEHGGRPEVLVAGRLDPLKRFDLAISAVAAIEPSRRPELRIVGAPPPDGEAYARSLHEAVAAASMLATTSFDGALRRSVLAERLRDNRFVCLMADRDLTRSGVQVDFFGEPTRLPAGPAKLAIATGAPLHPAHVYYDGDDCVVMIGDEIDTGSGDVGRITQALADRFAENIAAHPQDWHMLQPQWLADLSPERRARLESGAGGKTG